MIPLKTINYRGGIVRFRVPSSWLEEYKPEGGGTFYEDASDAGILRLNVLGFEKRAKDEGPLGNCARYVRKVARRGQRQATSRRRRCRPFQQNNR